MSTSQSMHISTSSVRDRARPQMTESSPRSAMTFTVSCSPSDDAGKPASIACTPIDASWRAMSSFCAKVNDIPGVCSPSRRVVSKTVTCVLAWLSVKKTIPRFSCYGNHTTIKMRSYYKTLTKKPVNESPFSAGHIDMFNTLYFPYTISAISRLNSDW